MNRRSFMAAAAALVAASMTRRRAYSFLWYKPPVELPEYVMNITIVDVAGRSRRLTHRWTASVDCTFVGPRVEPGERIAQLDFFSPIDHARIVLGG